MLVMDIPAGNIYELMVTAMMRSVFIFKIKDMESKSKKYELIYCLSRKPLLLEDHVLYIYIDSWKNGKVVDTEILEREAKSSLTLSLPQLHLDIHALENLCIALIEPPESRFFVSPDLYNVEHIYCNACAIISI